ncbi:Hypothetical protein, predicted transmembrane protein [Metamycoplasma auris 15026]|uniref:Uncharacterized protein n=1 Tax=Metamycoplasma auris 15026 TaxID=1188233 RepID=N9VAR1_9BACT|nr:hypothetical protein [Metamycoplasma auris]ENY68501.1 Hypothetical protein, predicted transmembrane protein [Metamycoplasma auris 15026]
MFQLTYQSAIFATKSSKLSPNVRLGLLISLFVGLSIAIIVLILSFIYKKRMTKKYILPNQEEEIAKLKERNPNYGIVLDGIKKFYTHSIDDFFTCFLINTIYLNNYQNIYLEDKNNYLALSLANLTKKEIHWNGIIDLELNKKIQLEFQELDFLAIKNTKKLNFIAQLIILLNNNNDTLNEKIKKHIDFLASDGILIIENNQNLKIKKIKEVALSFNLRYETLKFKNKNVILLAKNNIKEMLEEKEGEVYGR